MASVNAANARGVDPVGERRALCILVHLIPPPAGLPVELIDGFVIRLVTVQRRLLAMWQVRELRAVVLRRIGRRQRMHDPARFGAHVDLHAEVPRLAFARRDSWYEAAAGPPR